MSVTAAARAGRVNPPDQYTTTIRGGLLHQARDSAESGRLLALSHRDPYHRCVRATRAVIRLDNLRHNLDRIGDRLNGRSGERPGGSVRARPRICLAVKANAYGHGIVEVGRTAAGAGVECLAVATTDEAVELREAGLLLPILLYGLPVPDEIGVLVANDVTPLVGDADLIDLLAREAATQRRSVTVHLKIDTGMGRIGCSPDDAVDLARRISSAGSLRLAGVSTHFAAADSADPAFTETQCDRFEAAVGAIRTAGIDPGLVHAANSAGILSHPRSWYDMVRPGIMAYGYYPSPEVNRSIDLRIVMELRSRLVYVKRLRAGDPVSYGMTWRAPRDTWLGTIPVGYGDGYFRALSGRSKVLIRGESYPLVGRVCMDQVMVDLGDRLRVERYDDVVLFGGVPGAETAETLAAACGTIPYEITCAVSKRVPRIYVDGPDEG